MKRAACARRAGRRFLVALFHLRGARSRRYLGPVSRERLERRLGGVEAEEGRALADGGARVGRHLRSDHCGVEVGAGEVGRARLERLSSENGGCYECARSSTISADLAPISGRSRVHLAWQSHEVMLCS